MKNNKLPEKWIVRVGDFNLTEQHLLCDWFENNCTVFTKDYLRDYNYIGLNNEIYFLANSLNNGNFNYLLPKDTFLSIIQLNNKKEQYKFKRGDLVQVSMNSDFINVKHRIFVHYLENCNAPYICIQQADEPLFNQGGKFNVISWKYARAIEEKKEYKLNICEIADDYNKQNRIEGTINTSTVNKIRNILKEGIPKNNHPDYLINSQYYTEYNQNEL